MPAMAAWANRTASDAIDGIVVLYHDGTIESLLNHPLPVELMREVVALAHDRYHRRSSGVRLAVDVAEEDLGASAGIVSINSRRRSG